MLLLSLIPLVLTAWPADDAKVVALALPPTPTRKVRVFVDAGHGAPDNHGNVGCLCQFEQDHTARVAQYLSFVLAATGRFEVKNSRQPGEISAYRPRIAAAEAWKAEVIISLHSDARGLSYEYPQGDGGMCWRNPEAPGFSVLWNDEGRRSRAERGSVAPSERGCARRASSNTAASITPTSTGKTTRNARGGSTSAR